MTNMDYMFFQASSFNNDISEWDVSSVNNMDHMFYIASSFKQTLCGDAWVHSKASKKMMFTGSPGSLLREVCTDSRQYATRRPLTDRKLIVRTPVSTPVSTSTQAIVFINKMTCPKCGMFKKSGRASCCARGGAWHMNCGGAKNKNVDHMWSEGAAACKRKFKLDRSLLRPNSDCFCVFL